MNCQEVLQALAVPESEAVFAPGWAEAEKARPAGPIPFLTPEFVRGACGAAWLPEDMTVAVLAAARRIATDEALSALAWQCHYALFGQKERKAEIRRWPLLTAALDRDAGMFFVVVLLSGTPQLLELYRARGIPPEVAKATVLDLKLQLETEDYTHRHGRWGISPRILGWLMGHWRGQLYRLGRLQFVPMGFFGQMRAYRHRGDGTVVALSEAGVRYRGDGMVDGAGETTDPVNAWTSTLSISDIEVAGNPISPLGRAMREVVRLPAADWRQVLAPGETVLETHIAAGSPMDYDQCGDAMRQALSFFPKHFREKPFVGFACGSWTLDPQFERLLPPSSNLVRFQKETYLFPIKSGSSGVIHTVFGLQCSIADVGKFPRRTTMQRAFARHIEQGGHFYGGGGFLLKEDFDWGSQRYRRQRLPWQGRNDE